MLQHGKIFVNFINQPGYKINLNNLGCVKRLKDVCIHYCNFISDSMLKKLNFIEEYVTDFRDLKTFRNVYYTSIYLLIRYVSVVWQPYLQYKIKKKATLITSFYVAQPLELLDLLIHFHENTLQSVAD